MQQEFEVKLLDLDIIEFENKIIGLGAVLEHDEILMKRRVFNINDGDKGERYRLRQIGNDCTLTYKSRGGKVVGSTKELNVNIGNFDIMAEILSKIERKDCVYQENKRKKYMLGNLEIYIDSWPKIPTYVEIESDSIESVEKGLSLLGVKEFSVGDMGVLEVYERYGLDLHSFKELKFDK